jgi:HK97 family phage portal protein
MSGLNWWSKFTRLFARNRGADPRQYERFMLQLPSGIQLTEAQAMELSGVWACVHIIAVSIGACRINIAERTRAGKMIRQSDEISWLLNTRPNPDMTAIGFREAMLFLAVPFGNSYAEIQRDRSGQPVGLWPIATDCVRPLRDPETWEMFYEVTEPNGAKFRLEQRDVFHMRGPGINGLLGDNVVARAAKSLAVVAAQERYAASYFGNGANPGGVLEYPGQLTPERHAMLADDFKKQRSGPENAHRPLILEEGMKWNATALHPQESQLIEERQFSIEEIARWFNVPLHKIQHLVHATFSNIEHQSIEFVRDCLTPWCRRFEQEADYKLFPPGRYMRFTTEIDTTPLKEGDAKSRADAYAILRQNGIMSANEIREKEGLNNIGEEGDVLLVQSNMATVENIINAPPPGTTAPVESEDETEDETEDEVETEDVNIEALRIILGMQFARYKRRMAARRTDLSKHLTPQQMESNLAEESHKQLSTMLAELSPCAPFAVRVLGRGLTLDDLEKGVALLNGGIGPMQASVVLLPRNIQLALAP